MVALPQPSPRRTTVTPPAPRPDRNAAAAQMFSNLPPTLPVAPPIGRRSADRGFQLKPGLPETLKGLAVGAPSGLLGLPADALAFVFRDLPQVAEAFFTGKLDELSIEDKTKLDVYLSNLQKRAGAETIRKGIVEALGINTGDTDETREAFDQAAFLSEAVTPIPTIAGLAKLSKGRGPRAEILPPERAEPTINIPRGQLESPIIEGEAVEVGPRTTDVEPGIAGLLAQPRAADEIVETAPVETTVDAVPEDAVVNPLQDMADNLETSFNAARDAAARRVDERLFHTGQLPTDDLDAYIQVQAERGEALQLEIDDLENSVAALEYTDPVRLAIYPRIQELEAGIAQTNQRALDAEETRSLREEGVEQLIDDATFEEISERLFGQTNIPRPTATDPATRNEQVEAQIASEISTFVEGPNTGQEFINLTSVPSSDIASNAIIRAENPAYGTLNFYEFGDDLTDPRNGNTIPAGTMIAMRTQDNPYDMFPELDDEPAQQPEMLFTQEAEGVGIETVETPSFRDINTSEGVMSLPGERVFVDGQTSTLEGPEIATGTRAIYQSPARNIIERAAEGGTKTRLKGGTTANGRTWLNKIINSNQSRSEVAGTQFEATLLSNPDKTFSVDEIRELADTQIPKALTKRFSVREAYSDSEAGRPNPFPTVGRRTSISFVGDVNVSNSGDIKYSPNSMQIPESLKDTAVDGAVYIFENPNTVINIPGFGEAFPIPQIKNHEYYGRQVPGYFAHGRAQEIITPDGEAADVVYELQSDATQDFVSGSVYDANRAGGDPGESSRYLYTPQHPFKNPIDSETGNPKESRIDLLFKKAVDDDGNSLGPFMSSFTTSNTYEELIRIPFTPEVSLLMKKGEDLKPKAITDADKLQLEIDAQTRNLESLAESRNYKDHPAVRIRNPQQEVNTERALSSTRALAGPVDVKDVSTLLDGIIIQAGRSVRNNPLITDPVALREILGSTNLQRLAKTMLEKTNASSDPDSVRNLLKTAFSSLKTVIQETRRPSPQLVSRTDGSSIGSISEFIGSENSGTFTGFVAGRGSPTTYDREPFSKELYTDASSYKKLTGRDFEGSKLQIGKEGELTLDDIVDAFRAVNFKQNRMFLDNQFNTFMARTLLDLPSFKKSFSELSDDDIRILSEGIPSDRKRVASKIKISDQDKAVYKEDIARWSKFTKEQNNEFGDNPTSYAVEDTDRAIAYVFEKSLNAKSAANSIKAYNDYEKAAKRIEKLAEDLPTSDQRAALEKKYQEKLDALPGNEGKYVRQLQEAAQLTLDSNGQRGFMAPPPHRSIRDLTKFQVRAILREAQLAGKKYVIFPDWEELADARLVDTAANKKGRETYQKTFGDYVDEALREMTNPAKGGDPRIKVRVMDDFEAQRRDGGTETIGEKPVRVVELPSIALDPASNPVPRYAKGGEVKLGIGSMAREMM